MDCELVCIFPEGRLSPDGNLGEFRPGVEIKTAPAVDGAATDDLALQAKVAELLF